MSSRAIFEKNADACESAKYPACKCACGGALHGAKHSAAWRLETWGELERQRVELRQNLELELEPHAPAEPELVQRARELLELGAEWRYEPPQPGGVP